MVDGGCLGLNPGLISTWPIKPDISNGTESLTETESPGDKSSVPLLRADIHGTLGLEKSIHYK